MAKLIAKMRIRRAHHHNTPADANKFYQVDDKVLVWRERIVNHRTGEWVGPFIVLESDESRKPSITQETKISAARPFNVTQIK